MKIRSLTAACALVVFPLAACSITESNDTGDKTGSGTIKVTSTNDSSHTHSYRIKCTA